MATSMFTNGQDLGTIVLRAGMNGPFYLDQKCIGSSGSIQDTEVQNIWRIVASVRKQYTTATAIVGYDDVNFATIVGRILAYQQFSFSSSDANDTAAGSGAQKYAVVGVNEDLTAYVYSEHDLDGVSDVNTSQMRIPFIGMVTQGVDPVGSISTINASSAAVFTNLPSDSSFQTLVIPVIEGFSFYLNEVSASDNLTTLSSPYPGVQPVWTDLSELASGVSRSFYEKPLFLTGPDENRVFYDKTFRGPGLLRIAVSGAGGNPTMNIKMDGLLIKNS